MAANNDDISLNFFEPISYKLNRIFKKYLDVTELIDLILLFSDSIPSFESTMIQIHNEVVKHLPDNDLVNIILFQSDHISIYNQWLNIHNKLGKYSFLMKNGVAMSEIIRYETENNLELPADMRISFLFCNGIYFPPIFANVDTHEDVDSTGVHPQTPQNLNFSPEVLLNSLQDWNTLTIDYALSDEHDYEFIYFSNEAWRKNAKDWNELQHFLKWDDINFDGESFDDDAEKCFKFIKIIGDVPIYGDYIGNTIFWNVRNGQLYCHQWDANFSLRQEYYYDSFMDYLTQWSSFDYFNDFSKKWLRFDEEEQSDVMDINQMYEDMLFHLEVDHDSPERRIYFGKTGMKFLQIVHEQCDFQALDK